MTTLLAILGCFLLDFNLRFGTHSVPPILTPLL